MSMEMSANCITSRTCTHFSVMIHEELSSFITSCLMENLSKRLVDTCQHFSCFHWLTIMFFLGNSPIFMYKQFHPQQARLWQLSLESIHSLFICYHHSAMARIHPLQFIRLMVHVKIYTLRWRIIDFASTSSSLSYYFFLTFYFMEKTYKLQMTMYFA